MKAAFLFIDKYPNYDLTFQVFSKLGPDERKGLDTYIRCGVWDLYSQLLNDKKSTLSDVDKLRFLVGSIQLSRDGNLSRLSRPDAFDLLTTETIYTVQFDSIGRHLALLLHERLTKTAMYLGFVQILPQVLLHRQVFGSCGPEFKIERGKVYVLFSKDELQDNEWFADEKVEWLKSHYNSIGDLPLVEATAKLNVGARFTILDANLNPQTDLKMQQTITILKDEWESHSEKTIYKLQDIAPDALEELLSAIQILEMPILSSSDCAQMAVTFRRCLEKITDVYCPPAKPKDREQGWVKRQWKEFLEKKFSDNKAYGDYVRAEILGLDDGIGRLETLYKMGNKGVHGDWQPRVFTSVALRMVLLVNDLLDTQSRKGLVKLERDFYQHLEDLADRE